MSQMSVILGLEASCDETAAAVVRSDRSILSNIIYDQLALHQPYGGVVPEIAARAHAERLDIVTREALDVAGVKLSNIDAIAVTAGPGLIGGVMSAVVFAKALAAAAGLPVFGINHLAGHALTPRLSDAATYPYLMLLVSGGHCQFLSVLGPDRFERLGSTIDDAPGEAFDKSAKLMGLGYPGGPLIEQAAKKGNPTRFNFPRPLLDRPGCDMSFSGLKTALRRTIDTLAEAQGGLYQQDRADISAGFQNSMADVLAEKSRRALSLFAEKYDATTFAVAGGVAANQVLCSALKKAAADQNFLFIAPPLPLCTDNAAMIAWAGLERWINGERGDDPATLSPRPRWPLDPNAEPLLGSGKKGTKA